MGRRGPQPAPVSVQELRNARESRINREAPQLAPGLPGMPTDLLDGAEEVWRLVMATLGPSGAITPADGQVVRGYSEAVAIRNSLIALYRETGEKPMVRGPSGIVTNPILKEIMRAAVAVQAAGKELGMSPASRPGIRAVRTVPGDAFETFLSTQPKRRTPPRMALTRRSARRSLTDD